MIVYVQGEYIGELIPIRPCEVEQIFDLDEEYEGVSELHLFDGRRIFATDLEADMLMQYGHWLRE